MRKYRITESRLRNMIRESVVGLLNEIGDTRRGQWMLGRLAARQANRGDFTTASDKAYYTNGNNYSNEYNSGWDDEMEFMKNNNRFQIQNTYDALKMADMDDLGNKFIDFIEKYDGGVLMQTVVDYETGNQTGKKESPLKELIPYFEEEVLGYKCSPDMIKAITKAYNQWWCYAESELMDGYDSID